MYVFKSNDISLVLTKYRALDAKTFFEENYPNFTSATFKTN